MSLVQWAGSWRLADGWPIHVPNGPGGVVATFDGKSWDTYAPRTSGFSGSEPLAISVDAGGRIWIGTRTAGVEIYDPRE